MKMRGIASALVMVVLVAALAFGYGRVSKASDNSDDYGTEKEYVDKDDVEEALDKPWLYMDMYVEFKAKVVAEPEMKDKICYQVSYDTKYGTATAYIYTSNDELRVGDYIKIDGKITGTASTLYGKMKGYVGDKLEGATVGSAKTKEVGYIEQFLDMLGALLDDI